MVIYVWAVSHQNAIERAYDCHDYKDLAEALRKQPKGNWQLYKLEVTTVGV